MNTNSNGSKSVLIENETKNNNREQKSGTTYGSFDKKTNSTDICSDNNKGWLSKASSGVYNVGAGAVTYGWGGLKWALESTASVGTTVVSAGTEGVVRLKNRTTKDKNE